jgi:hypothetical protein
MNIHRKGTEFAEFELSFVQKLFTPRSEPVLSDVEGCLRGAISEPGLTESLKTQTDRTTALSQFESYFAGGGAAPLRGMPRFSSSASAPLAAALPWSASSTVLVTSAWSWPCIF